MNANPDSSAAASAPEAHPVRITPDFYAPGQYRPDQSVGYLMRRVLSSILTEVDARLAEHDLTYAQWLPLYKLTLRQCDTVASLSRDLGNDPGAITRALDRLEAKGLVRRERSATDRRVVQVSLTEPGRSVAAHVPPVLAEVLNLHLVGFSADEWHTLLGLLQRMLGNAEALRQGHPPEAQGTCPLEGRPS